MLCTRCANELPSETPVCPRCGPVTFGAGFGTTSDSPFTAAGGAPSAASHPAPPVRSPAPSPPPQALPAPPGLSAKQIRKQRIREALAARARGEAADAEAGAMDAASDPSAVLAAGEAPLTAFTRPGALTLLAAFDLLVGCVELFVAWAAFQGRTGHGPGASTDVATYGGVGLLYLVAGLGLLGLRQYGRYAQLVLVVLSFVSGFGSAIAAVLLAIYLMRPGVKVLLDDRDPRSLSVAERRSLDKDAPSPLLVPASVVLQALMAFVRLVPVLTVITG